MTNKISVLLDVATDKAVSGLKGFKASINDADGAVGKFKAGAGSAFDSIKGQAGNLAMVAGAALVTFGVKAVAAFQDSALSAGKFADATGLSTEAASRWVAVADDIGISGETMEKSFGKLAVAVGKNNPLLEQYGITVQKGADGQDDMNATMLHAVDVIRSIQDPTKKAAVAQAALGKGWMDMAELIEMGSGSLQSSMADVSEAQVIDPAEVEKARKMREAMDSLQDALRDVALVMGEDLVPAVTATAEALTTVIGPLSKVNQWSKNVATSVFELTHLIDKQNEAVDESIFGYGRMGESLAEFAGVGEDHIEFQEGMRSVTEDATEATEEASKGTKDFQRSLEDLNDAMNARITATNALVGGDIAVRDSQREAAAAVAELTAAQVEGKLTADELAAAQDGAAESLIGAAEAATNYDEKLLNASGQTLNASEKQDLFRGKLAEVAGTLAPGSELRVQLEAYIALLDGIPPTINTRVTLTGGDALAPVFGGKRAGGGSTLPGRSYLVGEEGPELLTMGAGSGHVTPNGALGGGGGGAARIYVTVNAGLGANGKEIGDIIIAEIKKAERRNGPGWRN